jgi:hypothetical protein
VSGPASGPVGMQQNDIDRREEHVERWFSARVDPAREIGRRHPELLGELPNAAHHFAGALQSARIDGGTGIRSSAAVRSGDDRGLVHGSEMM